MAKPQEKRVVTIGCGNWEHTPTLVEFQGSRAFFRGVMGPRGSAKSTVCSNELFARAVFQKPDGDKVRRTRFAVIRNCYDDQTEILTEKRGWQLFKNLMADDKVATLDGDELVFKQPEGVARFDYVGEMMGFESEGVDFLVTPDHIMYVSMRNARKKCFTEYRYRKAHEIYGKQNIRVKRDAKWQGDKPAFSGNFMEWLGFYIAEGSATIIHGKKSPQVIITQKNGLEFVRNLFEKANLPYSENNRMDGAKSFRLLVTPETSKIMPMLVDIGKAINKKIPEKVKNYPPHHLRRLISGYLSGDGAHRTKDSTVIATTASKQLADDMQEIGLKAGYVVNINVRPAVAKMVINGFETKQNGDTHSITFVGTNKYNPYLKVGGYAKRYKGWHKQQYNGEIFCVEMPLCPVYVRRNGKAFWCARTYKELEDTTLKTWLTWFPEEACGPVNRTKMIHHMKMPLPDGTRLDMEVLFRALDKPDDVKKVLSLELTGAWVNEAREVPKGLIDGLSDAVGRYPAQKDGGPTWSGIIADTNPPDDTSWWYRLAENPPWPDGWEFFKQPGGLVELPDTGDFVANPQAENVPNLPENYYLQRAAGKDADHIRVYYCNQYGFVKEGKPVIPEYIDAKHCIEEDYWPRAGSLVYVGLDFGLTPAAVFGQRLGMGRWIWFDELVTEDMGAVRFAEILGAKLRGDYKDCNFEIYGDPAGDYRAGTDERTPFLILREQGIMAYPAPSNDPVLRREAIAAPLTRLIDGEPGLVITRKCAVTRKGLAGGYFYRRLKVSGDDRYQEKPSKNRYSHPVEAGGYLMLGAGEGKRLVGQDRGAVYKMDNEGFGRFRSDYGPESGSAWMVV